MSEYNQPIAVNGTFDLPPAVLQRVASSAPIADAIRNGASNKLDALEKTVNSGLSTLTTNVTSVTDRVTAVEKVVSVQETQVLTPSGGNVSYTLNNLPVQGVLIKIPKTGITGITHPSGITWFDGKPPSIISAPSSVVLLAFIQVTTTSYIGYVIYGKDPTSDIVESITLKNYRCGAAMSNWLRGGTKYLGLYSYSTGTLESGFTTKNSPTIIGVFDNQYRNEVDIAPYVTEPTPDDIQTAGTLTTLKSVTLMGATFDASKTVIAEATFTAGSRPSLRIQGSYFDGRVAMSEITTDATGKYTNGYTGSVEGGLAVYGGVVESKVGDTLRIIIKDGVYYNHVRRAGSSDWIILHSGAVKPLPNDKNCTVAVGSPTATSQTIVNTRAFGTIA